MPYTLTFSSLHSYDPSESGVSVPVKLRSGGRLVAFTAKLDTGASFCIFQRTYGEALGFDTERGTPEWISTPTGNRFLTYGHEVSLTTLSLQIDRMVYFAADETFRRNVLGRRGWLDQVRIGVIDYDGKLYVSKYDDAP